QRFRHGDPELLGNHAGGLVHDEAQVAAGFELDAEGPRIGAGLHRDQRPPGDRGDDLGFLVLLCGEWPWAVAVEVERAEAYRPDRHREPEHRPRTTGDGRLREPRPPRRAGRPEIGLEDGSTQSVRVDA